MSKLLILAVVIPTLIGLFRFKTINTSYRLFVYLLITSSLSTINYSFNPSIYAKHLGSHLLGVVESLLMLLLLCRWDINRINHKLKCLFIITLIILQGIGVYLIKDNRFATNWPQILVLAALVGYGVSVLTQTKFIALKRNSLVARKLILIPYLFINVYYISIKILLHFLYSPANEPFFIDLYSLVVIFNFLSYICYSISLTWAPKKEKYL
jgi:hypothetical protein